VLAAWIAAVLVVAAVVAALAWNAGAGRWTSAPTVVGMDEAGATQLVREAELVPMVVDRRHDTIPAGRVAESDPPAQTKLTKAAR